MCCHINLDLPDCVHVVSHAMLGLSKCVHGLTRDARPVRMYTCSEQYNAQKIKDDFSVTMN
jgi:hypothetical protein